MSILSDISSCLTGSNWTYNTYQCRHKQTTSVYLDFIKIAMFYKPVDRDNSRYAKCNVSGYKNNKISIFPVNLERLCRQKSNGWKPNESSLVRKAYRGWISELDELAPKGQSSTKNINLP